MWRKLTEHRYRVLFLHMTATGGMIGAWSAMIGPSSWLFRHSAGSDAIQRRRA